MNLKKAVITGLLALTFAGAVASPALAREPERRGRATESAREDARHGRHNDDGPNHR